METLKKIFPLSFKPMKSGADLAIGIIIYVVAGIIGAVLLAVAGWLAGIIGGIVAFLGTLIGIVLGAIGAIIDVYVIAGIVIQILVFTKVIKE
ncbi:MAG: hypothetical protein E7667_02350 [Ruminococcaceae bacterium]|nr:hypothetical protein [Oscillospiraceae bacterium]